MLYHLWNPVWHPYCFSFYPNILPVSPRLAWVAWPVGSCLPLAVGSRSAPALFGGGDPQKQTFLFVFTENYGVLGRVEGIGVCWGGRGQADRLKQCAQPTPAKLAQDSVHQYPGALSHLQGPTPGDACSYDDPGMTATLPRPYFRNTN